MCEALNVDAIATVYFGFTPSTSGVGPLQKTFFTLTGTIKLYDKSGELILDAVVKSEKSKGQSSAFGFSKGVDRTVMFEELSESFLANLSEKLKNPETI